MNSRRTNRAPATTTASRKRAALVFVLLVGVLSLFAVFTYEGARSVTGPYLASLGASAAIVGIVTGFGEFVAYALRLASGRIADASGRFWSISILGYLLQMTAIPALGSAAIGLLYDYSVTAAALFCVVAELLAIPVLLAVARRRPVNK